jgi:hypothetical protein
MTFEAWKTHWGSEHENLPRSGRVDWRKLPTADRPLDRAAPADYALNEKSAANPAVGTASDGRDIGMETARLPAVPAKEAPAVESPGKEGPAPTRSAGP